MRGRCTIRHYFGIGIICPPLLGLRVGAVALMVLGMNELKPKEARQIVRGHCYCEGVHFEVQVPPPKEVIFSVYCHCENCRRSHAAPLYQVVCVDAPNFRITRGQDLVVPFEKVPGSVRRSFCRECGTRLYNTFSDSLRPGGRVPLAWFPNTLRAQDLSNLPRAFLPQRHVNTEGCVLHEAVMQQLLSAE